MAHMLYCPIHQKVWAYNYEEDHHSLEEVICHECEDALNHNIWSDEINAAS